MAFMLQNGEIFLVITARSVSACGVCNVCSPRRVHVFGQAGQVNPPPLSFIVSPLLPFLITSLLFLPLHFFLLLLPFIPFLISFPFNPVFPSYTFFFSYPSIPSRVHTTLSSQKVITFYD